MYGEVKKYNYVYLILLELSIIKLYEIYYFYWYVIIERRITFMLCTLNIHQPSLKPSTYTSTLKGVVIANLSFLWSNCHSQVQTSLHSTLVLLLLPLLLIIFIYLLLCINFQVALFLVIQMEKIIIWIIYG